MNFDGNIEVVLHSFCCGFISFLFVFGEPKWATQWEDASTTAAKSPSSDIVAPWHL